MLPLCGIRGVCSMKTWILKQKPKKAPRTIDRPGYSQDCHMKVKALPSKTGLKQRLLTGNPLKSQVTCSGCESRSPGRADAAQDPIIRKLLWRRVGKTRTAQNDRPSYPPTPSCRDSFFSTRGTLRIIQRDAQKVRPARPQRTFSAVFQHPARRKREAEHKSPDSQSAVPTTQPWLLR